MSETTARKRRHVYYSGRVQGVGFRFTTHAVAARFDVVGYVQNLPDGRVLVVAEGEAAELDRFFDALENEMARYIRGRHIEDRNPSGEFERFDIRR